jgi:hypothetical protein
MSNILRMRWQYEIHEKETCPTTGGRCPRKHLHHERVAKRCIIHNQNQKLFLMGNWFLLEWNVVDQNPKTAFFIIPPENLGELAPNRFFLLSLFAIAVNTQQGWWQRGRWVAYIIYLVTMTRNKARDGCGRSEKLKKMGGADQIPPVPLEG